MIRAASNRYKCALLLLDYPLHVDNELMHTVPHRESYREMYTSPARLGCPNFAWPRVFPLAFGESFTFLRLDKRIPKCSDGQIVAGDPGGEVYTARTSSVRRVRKVRLIEGRKEK
jgi:hypothetical protein